LHDRSTLLILFRATKNRCSRVRKNKQDFLFHKLFSRASNRCKPRDLFVFPVRLQEPAVIAVDRLHRFRWSGGGGGSSKKSSSGPRSEKAERLRELTEKLKGPAPIPPPRRPSRVQASSPPLSGYQPSSQSYPQVRNFNVTMMKVCDVRTSDILHHCEIV